MQRHTLVPYSHRDLICPELSFPVYSFYMLDAQASVMRSSVVELLAQRGRLEVLLHNRQGGEEMHWINGQPVSRLYRCQTAAKGSACMGPVPHSPSPGMKETSHGCPPPSGCPQSYRVKQSNDTAISCPANKADPRLATCICAWIIRRSGCDADVAWVLCWRQGT